MKGFLISLGSDELVSILSEIFQNLKALEYPLTWTDMNKVWLT